MSKRPLAIAGMGIISCLGEGAEINAAAMRCGYDGFEQTTFNQPYSIDKQIGAQIDSEIRGLRRIIYMSKVVVKEAIQDLPDGYEGLNIIYCMPEKSSTSIFSNDAALQEIIEETFKDNHLGNLGETSSAFWQQRCSFISAIEQAQELIYTQGNEFVLIVSLDSLLSNTTLSKYSGDLYGEGRRLLGDGHSDGFIPGEAANAILLGNPKKSTSKVIISGVGSGKETATIDNEEEVLKGNGIAVAIKEASKDSGIEVHDTGFRVSSVSGEEYFFNEAALAQIKTLKQKVDKHPLWHPSDSIGEVGAAIGGAITIMTYYAFTKSYALGVNALCHISNDNSQRGAFIMQYKTSHKGA